MSRFISFCFLSLGFGPFFLGVRVGPFRASSWPFLLGVGVGQLCVVVIVIFFFLRERERLKVKSHKTRALKKNTVPHTSLGVSVSLITSCAEGVGPS